jgi:hypothetical protein
MVIHGEAKCLPGLDLAIGDTEHKTSDQVLKYSASHQQLSGVVHQGLSHWTPLRLHQTEAEESPDTAFDESLASLITTKMPGFIHQGSTSNFPQ